MPKGNGLGLTPIQQQLHLTFKGRPDHVAVNSDDYERVLADVRIAAAALSLKVFRFTLTDGLVEFPGGKEVLPRNLQPVGMLDSLLGGKFPSHLNVNECGAVVVIEDFHPILTSQLVVRTRFREVCAQLRRQQEPVVLVMTVGKDMVVADELRASTIEIDYPAPTAAEIDADVARIAERVAADGRVRVDEHPETLGKVRNALLGLSQRSAKTTLAQAVARASRLDASIVPDPSTSSGQALLAGREQLFKTIAGGTGAQFITPPPRFRMAGNQRFKAFVNRVSRILADPEPAAPLPRAVLLIGPPGTGKTRFAFYTAAETSLPMIMLSMGSIAGEGGGRVGSIPGAMRAVQTAAEACAPCIILMDEVLKQVDDPANAKRGGGTAEYARAIADFQTWAETRQKPVIVFGTANVEDMSTGFPAGFLERFPYRWLTKRPTRDERAAIFAIELETCGYTSAQFDLAALATATEGWVGREIRDVVEEALGLAYDQGAQLDTSHVQTAIAALQTDTEEIAQWRFRMMDDPEPQPAPAAADAFLLQED